MVLKIVMATVRLERPSNMDRIMAGVKGTLFLLPLLGLTWIFGLLAINKDLILFEYAFAICNSLQVRVLLDVLLLVGAAFLYMYLITLSNRVNSCNRDNFLSEMFPTLTCAVSRRPLDALAIGTHTLV